MFAGVFWNRCQFHFQQNAQAYVPKQEIKTSLAADIRSIFNAESLALATQKLAAAVKKYSTSSPKLAAWMEEKMLISTLNFFSKN